MTKLAIIFIAIVTVDAVVRADTPSEQSVDRLLILSDADRVLRSVREQVDRLSYTGVELSTRGKHLSPTEKSVLESIRQELVRKYQNELRWEKFRDTFLAAFRQSFTQKEIDGIIAFFESPAGRAYATKMNPTMQRSSSTVQIQVQSIIGGLQREIKDAVDGVQRTKGP